MLWLQKHYPPCSLTFKKVDPNKANLVLNNQIINILFFSTIFAVKMRNVLKSLNHETRHKLIPWKAGKIYFQYIFILLNYDSMPS